ncbi:alginate O-acetyltransferase AlgX-related protein [Brumimicrobium aurantiacum]|uniref:AlgX/AlgJ SGNH hydrolase-like domain-containing protein n=1 Tax=Brumimicrobium aurantiacum TaxID=1737063 RepID=A0A3E1F0D1_9FLAO|nr:hypothetical protein [Brumimicrobium aurantiacum]RFC55260.1 hypothetical protein DXU93_05415 [Brumimicrobium aurantiacum]
MKESKLIKYQLSIIFLLIIIIPAIGTILGIDFFERKDENRAFKESINFNIKKLDNFPPHFNAYINDNFILRSPMLSVYHRIKFDIFKTSPYPEKAIIGKDGWMFKAGKETDIMSGELNFSTATLDSFTNEWKERKQYYEALEIPVYWMICPIKHRVYTEKLPNHYNISETSRINVLKKHLEKDFPDLIIDPTDLLKSKKKEAKLYFKLDNHWNERAGYYITEQLIEKLRFKFPNKDIPNIPEIKWNINEDFRSGFHHRVMGIDELSEKIETITIPNSLATEAEKYGFKGVDGFAYPWEFENRFIHKTLNDGLRVLFIRDSFGGAIRPFVKEVFQETLMIFDAWQYKINEEVIDTFKPDVVIYIGLETHIESFLKEYN